MSLHRWSMIGFEPPRFVGLHNFSARRRRTLHRVAGAHLLVHRARPRLQPAGRARHRAADARALSRAQHLPRAADPADGGDAGGHGAGVGDHARPDLGRSCASCSAPSASHIRRCGCPIPISWCRPWCCVDAWMWTPMVALICIAGLASLPPEPFEAALVDGASALQRFRYLTLPDDAADPDGGGDAAGDGPPEGDRHRLRDDRRRAGPSLRDDQPLQLSGGALVTTRSATASAIALVLFAIVMLCTLALIRLRRPHGDSRHQRRRSASPWPDGR